MRHEVQIIRAIPQAWLDGNFKKTIRNEMIIMRGDNVLTPQAVQKVKHF